MKVIVNLSTLLAKFLTDDNNVYLCHSLSALVKTGPIPVSLGSIDTITFMLHRALSKAYPQVFYGVDECDRKILDLWLRVEFVETPHDGLSLQKEWYFVSYTKHFLANSQVIERQSINIADDYHFKGELLSFLIRTYGDCEIVMDFSE